MPPKTNIATNLVGRTARPSPDTPWCWPWAYRFEPKGAALAETPREKLDKHGRFLLALYDDRAKVVGVHADKDGVKITLENIEGQMGECFAPNVALVPKGKPRTYTHAETHTILAGIDAAIAYFRDGDARVLRDVVALKEHQSAGMTITRNARNTIIVNLVASTHSYPASGEAREEDRDAVRAAIDLLRHGGRA